MNKFSSFEEYCASLTDGDILRRFYSNNYAEFYGISNSLLIMVNKYKNVPLTKHVMTDYEKRMIEKDPSYIEFIPRMEVKGYDRAVSGEAMENAIKREFCQRFRAHDKELFRILKRKESFRESVPFA